MCWARRWEQSPGVGCAAGRKQQQGRLPGAGSSCLRLPPGPPAALGRAAVCTHHPHPPSVLTVTLPGTRWRRVVPCLQLVRRNEELRLLYEKIKIQQSSLHRGQAQYRDRLNEIRVLKIKVGDCVSGGVGVWLWLWLCVGCGCVER